MLAIVNFIEGLNAFYFSSEMTKSINDKRYKAMFIIYIHIYVCGCVCGGGVLSAYMNMHMLEIYKFVL
jgi:hypothetical protein